MTTHKIIRLLFFMGLIIFGALGSALAEDAMQGPKMKVAVIEFQVKGDLGIQDAGSIIADWMITSLNETGVYALNERVLLTKVLEEQELSISGLVDVQTAVAAGRLYGVEAIVTGSILKWGEVISVTARIVNTQNGEIIKAYDVKTKNENIIREKIQELAELLAGQRNESVDAPSAISGLWDCWAAWSHTLVTVYPDGTCELQKYTEKSLSNEDSNTIKRYRSSHARSEARASSPTSRSGGVHGTWVQDDQNVMMWWDHGFINTMTLSNDGKELDGKNNWGAHVHGTKISEL